MNLDTLDRAFARLIVEAGSDPQDPAPLAAWQALIRLAEIPASIDDPGDDFLRFEAGIDEEGLGISLSRELSQTNGDLRGAVGCDFTIRTARGDADLSALIESATEPEFLSLAEFVRRVEASSAFAVMLASPIDRAARWSDVTVG